MTEVTGGCLCGATRYRAVGPAKFSIKCFCTDCQKVTGTGGAPQMAVDAATLTITGNLKLFDAKAESGSDIAFGFCGDCGSPLTKSTTRAPDMTFLYAGSLDNPSDFPEPKPVFESSRPAWDKP